MYCCHKLVKTETLNFFKHRATPQDIRQMTKYFNMLYVTCIL